MIVRWMAPRLAIGMFAAARVLLGDASAWAFSRENVLPDGGNYSFGDPDKQPTISDNQSSSQGAHPVVQFGVQQGTMSSFGQSKNYNTPDPYYQPLLKGN